MTEIAAPKASNKSIESSKKITGKKRNRKIYECFENSFKKLSINADENDQVSDEEDKTPESNNQNNT